MKSRLKYSTSIPITLLVIFINLTWENNLYADDLTSPTMDSVCRYIQTNIIPCSPNLKSSVCSLLLQLTELLMEGPLVIQNVLTLVTCPTTTSLFERMSHLRLSSDTSLSTIISS